MIKTLILTVLYLFLAAACTTTDIPPQVSSVPPATLSVAEPEGIPSIDYPQLRYGETLKAYSIGRRLDANDPSLMHEQSIIYRVENDSGWNLQPAYNGMIPYDGKSPVSTKEKSDALRAEIEVKANEQRRLYRILKEASDKAAGQVDALQLSHSISRKLLEQNKALKKELLESSSKNSELRSELEKLKLQMDSLLKFYQEKEALNLKSKFRRTP